MTAPYYNEYGDLVIDEAYLADEQRLADERMESMIAVAELYGVPLELVVGTEAAKHIPVTGKKEGLDPRTLDHIIPMCPDCMSAGACSWCYFPRCSVCEWPLDRGWCSFCDAFDWQAVAEPDSTVTPDSDDGPTVSTAVVPYVEVPLDCCH